MHACAHAYTHTLAHHIDKYTHTNTDTTYACTLTQAQGSAYTDAQLNVSVIMGNDRWTVNVIRYSCACSQSHKNYAAQEETDEPAVQGVNKIKHKKMVSINRNKTKGLLFVFLFSSHQCYVSSGSMGVWIYFSILFSHHWWLNNAWKLILGCIIIDGNSFHQFMWPCVHVASLPSHRERERGMISLLFLEYIMKFKISPATPQQ